MSKLTFAPPSKGIWDLDAMHIPRPATRVFQESFPGALKRGMAASLRRYGSGIDFLEGAFVNGFAYVRPRPVGAPASAVNPPPRLVFKLMCLLHPEIRRRTRTAERVFDEKPWRADLERWDREVKPAAIRQHLELQTVDTSGLSTEELWRHIERCHAHAVAMIEQHHQFDAPALLPVGDFMRQTQEWTGRSVGEVLRLLRGAAPESAGDSDELSSLAEAIRATPEARALIESGGAGILAALRALPAPVGPAAARYLERVEYRLSDGLDPGAPCLREMPELLVTRIRLAVEAPSAPARREGGQGLRDLVPAAEREKFDGLLGEARLISRLRDERGLYSEIWAWGIYRAAVLQAGERLRAAGKLHEAVHLVDAGIDEVRALLAGSGGPSADELAARAAFRAAHTAADAPVRLGPVAPPPPFDWMAPATRRVEMAIFGCIQAILADAPEQARPGSVSGIPVSPGEYQGTARVIRELDELTRVRPGDVLVTPSTSAAFNVVLPMLGAIVTDRGGVLSHAAIVAREFGIPAVVGCREATRRIGDGARLHVDGAAGEARVLA